MKNRHSKFRKFATENNSNLEIWAVGAPFVHVCFGNSEGQRVRYIETDRPTPGEFEEHEVVKLQTAGNIVEGGTRHVGDEGPDVDKLEKDKQTGYMVLGVVGAAVVLAIFAYYD